MTQRYFGVLTLESHDSRYSLRLSVINGATHIYIFDRKITNQSGLILKLFFPDSLCCKFVDFLNKIKSDKPKSSYPIIVYQNNIPTSSNAPYSITSRRPEFPARLIDKNGIHKQWRFVKEGESAKIIYETSLNGKDWKQESSIDIKIQTTKIIIGKDVEGIVFIGFEFNGNNNTLYKIKFPIISMFNAKFPDEPEKNSSEYLSKLAVSSFVNFLQTQLPVIQANSLTPAPDNTQIPASSNIDFFDQNGLDNTVSNEENVASENNPETKKNTKPDQSKIDDELLF